MPSIGRWRGPRDVFLDSRLFISAKCYLGQMSALLRGLAPIRGWSRSTA